MDIRIEFLSQPSADFLSLIELLDREFNDKIGSGQAGLDVHNKLSGIRNFFIAYADQIPVGTAAMKEIDPVTYEVKRVFVRREYRRKGISKLLMLKVEEKGKELLLKRLVLETSKDFKEAVGLYRKIGYETIENYGPYADNPQSVCFQKDIVQ